MIPLLKKWFHRETWQEANRRLYRELVPLAGEAESLQGELVSCVNSLSDECYRNGWMNWDGRDVESLEILRRYLPDPKVFPEPVCMQIHAALDAVHHAGKSGEGGYQHLQALTHHVVNWCRHQKELIIKDPAASWLDEPPNQSP